MGFTVSCKTIVRAKPVLLVLAAFLSATASAQTLLVTPSSLSFSAEAISLPPPPQTVTVINTGTTKIFAGTLGGPKFAGIAKFLGYIEPGASVEMQVFVFSTGFPPGAYDDVVTIGDAILPVHLAVRESAVKLSISPQALSFRALANGVRPSPQELTVVNTGTIDAFIVTGSDKSATIELANRTIAPGESLRIPVRVETFGLAPGSYSYAVKISGIAIPVQLTLDPPGNVAVSASTTSLSFTGVAFGGRQGQIATLRNSGTQNAVYLSMRADRPWLTFSHVIVLAESTADAGIYIDSATLGPGVHTGTVTITGVDGGTGAIAIAVQVILTQSPPGKPVFGAVLNAASHQAQLGVQNELISIVGAGLGPDIGVAAPFDGDISHLPTMLAETSVLVAGVPASLLYIQEGRITAIAPSCPTTLCLLDRFKCKWCTGVPPLTPSPGAMIPVVRPASLLWTTPAPAKAESSIKTAH